MKNEKHELTTCENTAQVDKQLQEIVGQVLNITNFGKDGNLKLQDAGLNSIKLIKIIIKIEEAFNFEFNDQDLYTNRFATFKDLKSYVLEQIK